MARATCRNRIRFLAMFTWSMVSRRLNAQQRGPEAHLANFLGKESTRADRCLLITLLLHILLLPSLLVRLL